MQKLPPKQAIHKSGDYGLVPKFLGYHAREDSTILPVGTLISPSQNVVINTSGRASSVSGYVLDGNGSSNIDSGILSNFDFINFKGDVRNLRCGFLTSNGNDGQLQYRYIDSSGVVNWVNLKTSLTTVKLAFCDYWDNTNLVKDVLWVDGSSNIFAWNGAVTTFSAASNSTGFIQVLDTTPTNGGTGYVVGDILSIDGGSATAIVTSVSGGSSGAVTGVSIAVPGSGYVIGDTLELVGGDNNAILVITNVDVGGVVTGVQISQVGSSYSANGYYNTE